MNKICRMCYHSDPFEFEDSIAPKKLLDSYDKPKYNWCWKKMNIVSKKCKDFIDAPSYDGPVSEEQRKVCKKTLERDMELDHKNRCKVLIKICKERKIKYTFDNCEFCSIQCNLKQEKMKNER